MAFLRSVATTTTAIVAASALPLALTYLSPSSSSSSSLSSFSSASHTFKILNLSLLSPPTILTSDRLGLVRSFTHPPSALRMDAPSSLHIPAAQEDAVLPELLTEFMVDMKCDGCVNAVMNRLQSVDGVKNVEVDLSNQVVRILGTSPAKTMTEALEQTGRNARLIGQGVPEDFLISAAVAEFKGPDIFGVVRLAQVSMELARIEANFSGLSPGKHVIVEGQPLKESSDYLSSFIKPTQFFFTGGCSSTDGIGRTKKGFSCRAMPFNIRWLSLHP